jgi:hypothetical protein
MNRKITCLNKIFQPKNCGYGLKDSGIGNCKECDIENNNACKCRNYLEVVVDEDDETRIW